MEQVVSAIFQNEAGEILILKRSSYKTWYPDAWDGIAEKMEPGETPEVCLHRGVNEEIGIRDIEVIQYGGAVEHNDGDRKWIVHPFLCRIKSGNIILNKEHTEFRWAHPTVLATEECIPPLKKDVHVLLGIEV